MITAFKTKKEKITIKIVVINSMLLNLSPIVFSKYFIKKIFEKSIIKYYFYNW